MPQFSWHDYLIILSFFASIGGIALLLTEKRSATNDFDVTHHLLMRMTFTYWLVYCVAFGIRPLIAPEWEIVLLSVKLTGVLSYLLTATCILSLPLHRVAARQME